MYEAECKGKHAQCLLRKQTVCSHNLVMWVVTNMLHIAKLCFVCLQTGVSHSL